MTRQPPVHYSLITMKRFLFFIVFVCCLILSGCRHVQYVAVPETHEVYIDRLIQDTTYVDRTHTEVLMGDTLFIHDSVNRYHAVILHDSVAVHDSVLDADLLANIELSLQQQYKDRFDDQCRIFESEAAAREAAISKLRAWLAIAILASMLIVSLLICLLIRKRK